LVERFPDCGSAFTDALLRHEFPRQRGENIVVLFQRRESLRGQLAL
jgi:hypothetical protein